VIAQKHVKSAQCPADIDVFVGPISAFSVGPILAADIDTVDVADI